MAFRGLSPTARWSLHMTGGWKAQLERVRRWHSRIQSAAEQDRVDFLFAFFENAFHLRDWLLDTSAVEPDVLAAFFAAHVEMRLCRDIANLLKHYSIDRPSQPIPPSLVLEYAPTASEPDMKLVVLSDGVKYDAFELASRCMRLWEEFVRINSPISDDPIQAMSPFL